MLELAKVKRLLVIKPSSLGDIFHVFPALAELRHSCPQAELDFLVHPAFADILDYSPFPVSERIIFEREKMGRFNTMIPEFLKLVRVLRSRNYDLVIDFQGLLRSSLFATIAKGGPSIGFAHPREPLAAWFYHQKVDPPQVHALERNCELVRFLTGKQGSIQLPEIPPHPVAQQELEQAFGVLPEKLIALIPGARWQSKQFPPRLFAEIAKKIHQQLPEYTFAIMGSRSEQVIEQELIKLLGGGMPVLPMVGKTNLRTMMEALRASSLVISNDSGPSHAAATLKKNIFVFFGPTIPAKTGPYGNRVRIYQRKLECIQCMKRHCNHDENGGLRCHQLDVDAIASDAYQVLTQPQEN